MWANLRFNDYERLVLFYCTFIAMKRQDFESVKPGLEDNYPLRGEVEEFGGEIEDGQYLHALRVFSDRDTGCVRMEATALRGPMKKTPIWTAFVTNNIGSRTFLRRLDHRTIQLRQLKPYMFCENYKLPSGRDGKYELRFTSRDGASAKGLLLHRGRYTNAGLDAENFIDVFETIQPW